MALFATLGRSVVVVGPGSRGDQVLLTARVGVSSRLERCPVASEFRPRDSRPVDYDFSLAALRDEAEKVSNQHG